MSNFTQALNWLILNVYVRSFPKLSTWFLVESDNLVDRRESVFCHVGVLLSTLSRESWRRKPNTILSLNGTLTFGSHSFDWSKHAYIWSKLNFGIWLHIEKLWKNVLIAVRNSLTKSYQVFYFKVTITPNNQRIAYVVSVFQEHHF